MARFDVYAHPDSELRQRTPFLLDVQNSYLNGLDTRVVIPLRAEGYLPLHVRDINHALMISGERVIMDAAAIAAFPAKGLNHPIEHWQQHSDLIISALDTLFGGY
jgi:toxin CcdB